MLRKCHIRSIRTASAGSPLAAQVINLARPHTCIDVAPSPSPQIQTHPKIDCRRLPGRQSEKGPSLVLKLPRRDARGERMASLADQSEMATFVARNVRYSHIGLKEVARLAADKWFSTAP